MEEFEALWFDLKFEAVRFDMECLEAFKLDRVYWFDIFEFDIMSIDDSIFNMRVLSFSYISVMI